MTIPAPSAACAALIRQYEECRLYAYQDPGGVWTIGWGHTGPKVKAGLVWTQRQADTQLERDMLTAFGGVLRLCLPLSLSQGQVDALIDFVFNEGEERLMASTLLKRIKAGDMDQAAAEFLRWDMMTEDGKKVENETLERRRTDEQKLFIGGLDPTPSRASLQ